MQNYQELYLSSKQAAAVQALKTYVKHKMSSSQANQTNRIHELLTNTKATNHFLFYSRTHILSSKCEITNSKTLKAVMI